MSLDRDELTARFAVEYAVRNGFHPENAARQGREAADALLLALTPTPAPVAPPAGKYEPRVGDVVRFVGMRHAVDDVDDTQDRLLVRVEDPLPERDQWVAYGLTNGNVAKIFPTREWWSYLRPGTSHELGAAGLSVPPPAPTPAPEAKRPTVIRLTSAHAGLPVDAACRVLAWHGDTPLVRGAPGYGDTYIGAGKWAPAPCPPPVAGRVEKDALRDAESQVIEAAIRWRAAYCGGAGDYINDAADERVALDSAVANLATLRSALARPVRP